MNGFNDWRKNMTQLLFLFGLLLSFGDQNVLASACTEIERPDELTTPEHWQSEQYVIGTIIIRIKPIFNATKSPTNSGLSRWTNRFHIQTKPHVVKQQLLFKEGDHFSISQLQESERIIRANSFFYDATISPLSACNKQVTVLVEARDLWTLIPDLDFQRSGGDNSSRLGFRDSNFLGLGKRVVVVRKSDDQRSGLTLSYTDPNLLGSRYQLQLTHEDNDDGHLYAFNLERPFYAIATPWSKGIQALNIERDNELFSRNQAFQAFKSQQQLFTAFVGRSTPRSANRYHRWLLGYTHNQNEFFSIDSTNPNALFPVNRKYAYPWLGWQLIDNNFIEVNNLDQMNRTEDLNLGWDLFFRLGHAFANLGSDASGIVFDGYLRKNYRLNNNQILNLSTEFSGIEGDVGLLNFKTSVAVRYYHRISAKQQFFALIQLKKSQRLFNDKQLLLGGDSGLRGYPSRYQNGDRSFLITFEQRFYFNHELWQLFDTGAVLFADVGRAWFSGKDNGINGDILKNIGIGVRLSPTRAGKNVVLHLDFALPLDKDDPSIDNLQINFVARRSF